MLENLILKRLISFKTQNLILVFKTVISLLKKKIFLHVIFFSSLNSLFCILVSNAACLPTYRAELC